MITKYVVPYTEPLIILLKKSAMTANMIFVPIPPYRPIATPSKIADGQLTRNKTNLYTIACESNTCNCAFAGLVFAATTMHQIMTITGESAGTRKNQAPLFGVSGWISGRSNLLHFGQRLPGVASTTPRGCPHGQCVIVLIGGTGLSCLLNKSENDDNSGSLRSHTLDNNEASSVTPLHPPPPCSAWRCLTNAAAPKSPSLSRHTVWTWLAPFCVLSSSKAKPGPWTR